MSTKQITTLQELDAELLRVDEAHAISDDELRKALASFEFVWPHDEADTDPYSEAYRQRQFELYYHLAGIDSYDPKNERSEFNMEDCVRSPFPYYTKSAATVGDQLMAIGFIVKTMNLPSGSSVLEFGPGWGNTTIALARMGYKVTVVDIEADFLELIRRRAGLIAAPVKTVHGNFGIPVGWQGERFDAVLFFESFHHCGDHLKLIGELKQLVEDSGVIVFAAEPITDALPLPWGVRTDGMSAWSIRRFKWLELGFKESYFVRTMMERGWIVEKYSCPSTPLGIVFTARKNLGTYPIEKMLLPSDEGSTWGEADASGKFRRISSNTRLTLDSNAEWKACAISVINLSSQCQKIRVSCSIDEVQTTIPAYHEATMSFPLAKPPRVLRIFTEGDNVCEAGISEVRFQLQSIAKPHVVVKSTNVRSSRVLREQHAQTLPNLTGQLPAIENLAAAVGKVNPRRGGPHNWAIQFFKSSLSRMLSWYTRPLQQYQAAVAALLKDNITVLSTIQQDLKALEHSQREGLEQEAHIRNDQINDLRERFQVENKHK